MNNSKIKKDEKNQKRWWQCTPKTPAVKSRMFAYYTAVYLTFMAVYFGISEITPIWDFFYFTFHNILALSLLKRLMRYENKKICIILSTIFYLNIIHDILFYLCGIDNTRFFAGAYFIIALILLIINREKL